MERTRRLLLKWALLITVFLMPFFAMSSFSYADEGIASESMVGVEENDEGATDSESQEETSKGDEEVQEETALGDEEVQEETSQDESILSEDAVNEESANEAAANEEATDEEAGNEAAPDEEATDEEVGNEAAANEEVADEIAATEEELEEAHAENEIVLASGSKTVTPGVTRISGETAIETAIEVSKKLQAEIKKETGKTKFDYVLVARNDHFADALSGSYLAIKKEAPILLLKQEKKQKDIDRNQKVLDYIKSIISTNGKIYVLGGEAAVSESLENRLGKIAEVSRLAGQDALLTNIEILKEAGIDGEDIIVATAKTYPDALSASSVGKPILIVRNGLTNDQSLFLDEYVLGKKIVHHEAEYETIHHEAEYETVHHDAEYETKSVPYTEIEYYTGVVCNDNRCAATFDNYEELNKHRESLLSDICPDTPGLTFLEASNSPNDDYYDAYAKHFYHNSSGTKTLTREVTKYRDEQVLVKEAYDEQVLVKDAWDEQILIKEAYDEVINNPKKAINIYVVGGTAAVSDKIKGEVSKYSKNMSATRVYGDDMFDTAIAIYKKFYGSAQEVGLATGKTYHDALVGGPYAYLRKMPILLTTTSSKFQKSFSVINSTKNIKAVTVFGGTTAVQNDAIGMVSNGTKKTGLVTVGGKKYYAYANGTFAKKKTVTVNNTTYYFGDDTVGRVNGIAYENGAYYLFNNGKKATNVCKSYTENGVTWNVIQGVATKVVTEKDKTLNRALKLLTKITKESMTMEQKLRACWDYFQIYSSCAEKHPRIPHYRGLDWPTIYANDVFINKEGNCISMGAAFGFLAKAIGYKNVYGCQSYGHGWTEINGLIYDTEWARWHKVYNYYGLSYDAKTDQGYKGAIAEGLSWMRVKI